MKKTLLDELIRFSKHDKVRAHMPGHNGGQGLSSKFRRNAFAIDVTEFSATDNLQEPSGILLKSEEYASEVFGASRSFFIVNGSTLGIEAAILSTTKRGDKIIVDRSCHKAVISGMILAGAKPVFVEPEFDFCHGIYSYMSPIAIKRALLENPDAVAVIITTPNYYGVCSDVKKIAEIAHKANKVLIVDEAHGAHFVFSEMLPKTALEQGADIVIQSAHKTLPSLGQTALLHIGETNMDDLCERIQKNINLIQTSSPSYMLLAGLDDSIRCMSKANNSLDKVIIGIEKLKASIDSLDNISCIHKIGNEYDITKLVVDFSAVGISGYYAAELLKNEFGIYTEMSDQRNVLFYLTACSTMKDLEKIENAIIGISNMLTTSKLIIVSRSLPKVKIAMDMGDAYFSKCRTVSCDESIGQVAAEIVVSCPPCCPIIIPGQMIDEEIIDYIKSYTDIKTISVIDIR